MGDANFRVRKFFRGNFCDLFHICIFSLFNGELDYVHRLLEEDVRNNSAWNQRFFVIKSTNKEITGDVLSSEVEYAMRAIEGVTGNESAWNYLTG